MKPEDQQIAIMEVMRENCKCKDVGNEKACNWNCPCGNPVMSGVCRNCCRNYLTDLNACHEMEKVITEDPADNYSKFGRYLRNLEEIVLKDRNESWIPEMSDSWSGYIAFATAAQRAEAFLRTLNLWKD